MSITFRQLSYFFDENSVFILHILIHKANHGIIGYKLLMNIIHINIIFYPQSYPKTNGLLDKKSLVINNLSTNVNKYGRSLLTNAFTFDVWNEKRTAKIRRFFLLPLFYFQEESGIPGLPFIDNVPRSPSKYIIVPAAAIIAALSVQSAIGGT